MAPLFKEGPKTAEQIKSSLYAEIIIDPSIESDTTISTRIAEYRSDSTLWEYEREKAQSICEVHSFDYKKIKGLISLAEWAEAIVRLNIAHKPESSD